MGCEMTWCLQWKFSTKKTNFNAIVVEIVVKILLKLLMNDNNDSSKKKNNKFIKCINVSYLYEMEIISFFLYNNKVDKFDQSFLPLTLIQIEKQV